MRVAVTGGAGWLGRALVERLVPICDSVRVLILPDQAAPPGTEGCVGDLRDPAAGRRLCAGQEVVFHCAGVIHPRRPVEWRQINVEGTRQLLTAAHQAGVRRVVAVSSNSPFGSNPHGDHLFDEDSPYHPYLGYGRSKMLMEQAVLSCPLDKVVVRCPWFYGPGQPARQTRFFRMVGKGMFPLVGDGSNLRSMSYVENLASGLVLAGRAENPGPVYWVADRRPYPLSEILAAVRGALQDNGLPVRPQRVRLPNLVGTLAWLADATLQRAGLYHQSIHVLSEVNQTIACSVERAVQELGYQPEVELWEGMRRSVAWCLEQGHPL